MPLVDTQPPTIGNHAFVPSVLRLPYVLKRSFRQLSCLSPFWPWTSAYGVVGRPWPHAVLSGDVLNHLASMD